MKANRAQLAEPSLSRETGVQPRVALSVRLPRAVVSKVDTYAQENRVSKTDALLHFLQKGIAAEDVSFSDAFAQIGKMQEDIAEIKALLASGATQRKADLPQVKRAIMEAAGEFPAIRRAYLFGSFARGEYSGESDIDIRIERDAAAPLSLIDLSQFAKRIERATGRQVDVVSAQRIKNNALATAIEKDKVLIYERDFE